MEDLPSCALCRRRRDSMVALSEHLACLGCLAAVGRFLRGGRFDVVQRLWHMPQRFIATDSLNRLLTEEMAALKRGPTVDIESLPTAFNEQSDGTPRVAAASVSATNDPLGELTAEGTKGLNPEDWDTHLNLAIAYRDIGLLENFLEEVAILMQHGAGRMGKRAQQAAALLFDRKLLRNDLTQTLKALRVALYPE